MEFFVHPQGICESAQVGKGTRVWAFAHVLPGAQVGVDCNICDHTFIENDVVIGDRVTVKCGVQLWDGLRVEDDVFIGPNATFTNDRFPRSRQYPPEFPQTRLCKGASIGANSTILPGLVIGQYAMVGAGSVVTKNVPPNAIVVGNPARIVGYVDAQAGAELQSSLPANANTAERKILQTSQVKGVCLHRLKAIDDLRGNLIAGEFSRDIPFEVKRYFIVLGVPTREVRGEHAHRSCQQFLTCVRGSVSVVADDGDRREEFLLDSPDKGLYLPNMVWGIQYKYSPDALLLVFASEFYDPEDYIRSYDTFLELVRKSTN